MSNLQIRALGDPITEGHEWAILDLTRDYLALPDNVKPPLDLGELLKHYLWAAGYIELASEVPDFTIELRPGEVVVTSRHRTRASLNRLARAVGNRPDDLTWRLAGATLPGTATSRMRGPKPKDAALTLATFYLSVEGGGRLDEEEAARRVEEHTGLAPATDKSDHQRRIGSLRRILGRIAPDSVTPA